MGNVSGIADASKRFASFLRVARKFNYSCAHIFHIIYPEKAIWRSIILQTSIFNIFPVSVHLSRVQKILKSACIRKTRKYIPAAPLWISRLFIELTNRNERVCLRLDCSGVNRDGAGRFRTETDNPDFQTCYFNVLHGEQS